MPSKMPPPSAPSAGQGEIFWRNGFFYLSAVMAAFALVDFDAGRLAHGLGDAAIACLMLSLMTQYPFVRAIVAASKRAKPREELLREVQRLKEANPWGDRLSLAGWTLLAASLVLRAIGVD
ncbi:hypothetical protein FBR04_17810 [Betaproteobacteria bacterium PRO7]|nr:hypothetical protein [Betaproteobacteria bacterium PRO7]